MGGEAGSAAAVGSEGRVKSLGLVFEDERKGCYSSGETVAGHVLLEAAEPVALRALRLEAHGRATAAWGPSPGAAAPAAASEVEYLNVRLSLREPPAGERGPRPRSPRRATGRSAEGLAGTGRERAGGCPPARGAGAGSGAGVRPRGGPSLSLAAGDGWVTMPVPPSLQSTGAIARGECARLPGASPLARLGLPSARRPRTFQDCSGSEPLPWEPVMSSQKSKIWGSRSCPFWPEGWRAE